MTFILIPQAEAELQQLQERTNLSRTDLTNRAISLYTFIDTQLRAGRDMVAMDKETGQTAKVLVQLPDAPDAAARTVGRASWRSRRLALQHPRRRRLFQVPDWPAWPTPKLA